MPTDLLKPIRNKAVVDDALAAIDGMLPGEVSDRLKAMEKLRLQAKKRLFGKKNSEIRILRAEVAELALALQRLANTENSQAVQAANYADYTRLVGGPSLIRDFQQFLRDSYRSSMEEWDGVPLLEIARRLLDGKR